jgi:hypothetical protein
MKPSKGGRGSYMFATTATFQNDVIFAVFSAAEVWIVAAWTVILCCNGETCRVHVEGTWHHHRSELNL